MRFNLLSFISSLLFLAGFTSPACSQNIYLEEFSQGIPATYILYNQDSATPQAPVSFVTDAWVAREDFINATDSCAFSTSWYTIPSFADDWMVTDTIRIDSFCILRWEATAPDPSFPDGYRVFISPNGSGALNDIQTQAPLYTNLGENPVWTKRFLDLDGLGYRNSTVRFAFQNNSPDRFLLMLDRIAVRSRLLWDLELLNLNPLTTYTQVPAPQSFPLTLEGEILNIGRDTVTNVAMLIQVFDAANNVVQNLSSNFLPKLAPLTVNPVQISPYIASQPDTLRFEFVNFMLQIDLDGSNDSLTQSIIVSDSVLARDDGRKTGSVNLGTGGSGIIGQSFVSAATDHLTSVSFLLENSMNTMGGQPVHCEIWSFNNGVPASILARTDTLTLPANPGQDFWVHLKVSGGPLSLPADTFYIGVVHGPTPLDLGWTSSIYQRGTGFLRFPGSSGWRANEDFGYTFPYMLRANFGCTLASTSQLSHPLCNGDSGSISLSASGGQGPYSWAWNNGASGAQVSLPGGTWQVTLSDAEGCSSVSSYTLNEPAPLSCQLSATDASGGMVPDGSATAACGGGTPPLRYQWSNGDTTDSISGLLPGTYFLTLTDANGCQRTDSVFVDFTINQDQPTITDWQFQVYPSVFRNKVTLEVNTFNAGYIPIFPVWIRDVQGKMCITYQFSFEHELKTRLDLKFLPAGVYTIHTPMGTQKVVRK